MKIEDYAVIGDLHTVALVGANGSIDWLCLPRFDSAACFASLLGDDTNGYWKIAPSDPAAIYTRRYRPDTLILETEWRNETGAIRVTDFMPTAGSNRDVVRIVEGVSGTMPVNMTLVVRFDYGRTVPWVRHLLPGGIVAVAGPSAVTLRTAVPLHGCGLTTVSDFAVHHGDRHTFALSAHSSHEFPAVAVDPDIALRATDKFWKEWTAQCTYCGPWREAVMRSLITLKALTYAPTGGIVAAATTSLPEWIGSVRNWDYRYCWLRDATFTLYSFLSSGYREEAQGWSEWLLRAVAGDPAQLQIMYGVAGERSLPELEVPHLRGYEDSRPVRIGNAAAAQFQLDVYGEVMDAMHLSRTLGIETGHDAWRLQRHLADFVARNWREPDEGIWEIRGPRRHFTHSKVMAWVALDRAVKAVRDFGLEGDADAWAEARDEIHRNVCANGFSAGPQAFTQYYGGDALDASLLMMPLVGFLPPTDPRVISTIDAIARELTVNGLVQRYKTEAKGEVDGLPPDEGTFLPCSFWLADCLHLLGRETEAKGLFQRLLALRNDLGLISEEYDPIARRQLGNVPQAFTHVCMVNSALNLSPRAAKPADERSAGIS
jgi:GH15 family glucan-1,4-alpha-glucosidase